MKKTIATLSKEKGLEKFSKIILTEGRSLIPHVHNLPIDTDRMDRLWRTYTRTGLYLSNGGVSEGLLSLKDIKSYGTPTGFNLYRSDRPESVGLKQDRLQQFLVEEGVLAKKSDSIFVEFSLGSHEGITRILRCIHSSQNSGMMYPCGGYSLIVRAAATSGLNPFKVFLIQTDSKGSEKIDLNDLYKQAKKHPKAKTLYLENKTMAGAVYTEKELDDIVKFCKTTQTFLILDSAHMHMEFEPKHAFPTPTPIFEKNNFTDFAVIITGSKTYGLERGRVGFVVLGNKTLATTFRSELTKQLGSLSDLSIEVADALISTPIKTRKAFIAKRAQAHLENLTLMISYLEGIKGLDLVFKPQSGIQLKVDMAKLRHKFFGNMRMVNAEIFSYALHSATDIVILHAFQLMDPKGTAIRLSFSCEEDIHKGMKLLQDFVHNTLTDKPTKNPFMPDVELAEQYVFPSKNDMKEVLENSYTKMPKNHTATLIANYRKNLDQNMPRAKFLKISDQAIENALNQAATAIQKGWKYYKAQNNLSK